MNKNSNKSDDGFHLIRADQVQPTTVSWLWDQRIAFGKISLLVGNPGNGKSMLICDVAARISAGRPLPGVPTSSPPPAPGGVLLLSGEDDASDTIIPRLQAHGADLSKVQLLPPMYRTDDTFRVVNLSKDIEKLGRAIDDTPHCRLVCVDPLAAFMGKIDSFVDSDVRTALTPLADLAARKGVAILVVMHLNKKEAAAIFRANGSIAFSAAARAVYLACRRKDPSRRLFVPVKVNLSPDDEGGLEFTIQKNEHSQPVIHWESEPVMLTANQALAEELKLTPSTSSEPKAREVAKDWLKNVLAEAPKTATWIRSEAKDKGISPSTLERARDDLGIVEVKIRRKQHWKLGNTQATAP